jgi:acyl carrier protein
MVQATTQEQISNAKETLAKQSDEAKSFLKKLSRAVHHGWWLDVTLLGASLVTVAEQALATEDWLERHQRPMTQDEAVFEWLSDTICTLIDCHPSFVNSAASLDGLGLDTLDTVALAMKIEHDFDGIMLGDEADYMDKWATVGDIIQWLKDKNAVLKGK